MTRGRPRSTTPQAIEAVAVRLFTEVGFDDTTIDQIATAAGVSRRTFFRYFPNKGAVLWSAFEAEVARLKALLDAAAPDQPIVCAVRSAVIATTPYSAADAPELRVRMRLLSTSTTLSASAMAHYAAWEDTIAEFVARRTGRAPTDLIPMAVGRATLAVCRAAFDQWFIREDDRLSEYLGDAISALFTGFAALTSR